jgi:hypothetical protein
VLCQFVPSSKDDTTKSQRLLQLDGAANSKRLVGSKANFLENV